MSEHRREVSSGQRFAFGKNWGKFLAVLDENRICEAEKSLQKSLGLEDLSGKTFLDMGSGSGLFSLAARRLGASVRSFDYDPASVACADALKKRYFTEDPQWVIGSGSVLDLAFIRSLGTFDIVYSWGVLHHTGAMWKALAHADLPVRAEGRLFISIYNDQGPISVFWRRVKRFYCAGFFCKIATLTFFFPYFFFVRMALDLARFKNPATRYFEYRKSRGMSVMTDWVDWLGGYPFEVAKAEDIFDFYQKKGYALQHLRTTIGLGCNQFVFRKISGTE